jgi:hypothetical protein
MRPSASTERRPVGRLRESSRAAVSRSSARARSCLSFSRSAAIVASNRPIRNSRSSPRSWCAARGREQPVVGREQRSQVEPGQNDESRSGDRDDPRQRAGERSQRRPRPGVDGDRHVATSRGGRGQQERRVPAPVVCDLARRRTVGRQPLGRVDLRAEGANPPPGRVVGRDVEHVALERDAAEGADARFLGGRGRDHQAAQNAFRPLLDGLASPIDGAPEEEEREQVQEEDQDESHPQRQTGLAAEALGDSRRGSRERGAGSAIAHRKPPR